MRVLLINPPYDATKAMSVTPSVVEEERGHNPPLGVLYVAAYTARAAQVQPRLLAEAGPSGGLDVPCRRVRSDAACCVSGFQLASNVPVGATSRS